MWKSYLTLAYRNLLKNKVASALNLVGLAVALGCAIVVYVFVTLFLNMDTFHARGERIVLVGNTIDRDGTEQVWGDAPRPLGPMIEADLPQVERAVRIAYGSGRVEHGDNVFNEYVWYADPGVLDVLTFPLQAGTPDALTEPDAIILSDAMATKYFGEADPLGQPLRIRFDDEHDAVFIVRGVAAEFPDNASFSFNALLPYRTQEMLGEDLSDWARYTGATFLLLNTPDALPAVAAQMDRYQALQNAASDDWPIAAFHFVPLRDLSRNSFDIRGDISRSPHPAAFVVFPLVAIFLLALACFNYMNIAVATAARRIKEIGVRKAVGGSRRQLIVQFLSENVLICLLALGLGVLAATFFLMPAFSTLFEQSLSIPFTESTGLWAFMVGLVVLVGLVSGGYPALYLSSFAPSAVFRGTQRLGHRSRFTQGFLTFQFVLAFITMMMGVVLVLNARYQADRDWGYGEEHVYTLRLSDPAQYTMLKPELEQHPKVATVAGARVHVGRGAALSVVEVRGEQVEVNRFDVGFDYLETLGLRLKAGRFLDRQFPSDASGAIVINETFAQSQDWTDPLGQTMRQDSLVYTVVGVVEDFHYFNFFEEIRPAFFRYQPASTYQYLTVRTEAGAGLEVADFAEAAWERLVPDVPYDGFFQDAVFDDFYRENRNITEVFTFTALLALFIACMGLFGLAAQNITRRMKEISIRKVLGATVLHVTSLVNRRFLLLLGLAALIATPISYFLLDMLLDQVYRYRMPLGPGPFLLSYGIVLGTAVVTVGLLLRRIVTMNPAEVLRTE